MKIENCTQFSIFVFRTKHSKLLTELPRREGEGSIRTLIFPPAPSPQAGPLPFMRWENIFAPAPSPPTLHFSGKEEEASTETGRHHSDVHVLHNQIHIVLGGEMGDVPSASNDPIFPLHHAFVDRIYEKWLRKFNKDANVLSTYDAPIGHNRDDVIVPLFPVYTHQQMFKKSFEFGYNRLIKPSGTG